MMCYDHSCVYNICIHTVKTKLNHGGGGSFAFICSITVLVDFFTGAYHNYLNRKYIYERHKLQLYEFKQKIKSCFKAGHTRSLEITIAFRLLYSHFVLSNQSISLPLVPKGDSIEPPPPPPKNHRFFVLPHFDSGEYLNNH